VIGEVSAHSRRFGLKEGVFLCAGNDGWMGENELSFGFSFIVSIVRSLIAVAYFLLFSGCGDWGARSEGRKKEGGREGGREERQSVL
jgi:hypothetical protein